jgi:hypothetical protein
MTPTFSPVSACLAKSSPDVASVSWLIVNLLCMAWSLYVAVNDIWTRIHEEEPDDEFYSANNVTVDGDDEDDDDNIVPDLTNVSPSGRATVEYLVWSMMTTIVWIVEVALRTAFPPPLTANPPPQNGDDIVKNSTDGNKLFENKAGILAQVEELPQSNERGGKRCFHIPVGSVNCDFSFQQEQLEPFQQRLRQRRFLVMELLLAIFFFVESANDYRHWRARVAEDDVVGEVVDTWISILGYIYMIYETCKAISRKRKDYATRVHLIAAPTTTSPLMKDVTSYMTIMPEDSHESTRENML